MFLFFKSGHPLAEALNFPVEMQRIPAWKIRPNGIKGHLPHWQLGQWQQSLLKCWQNPLPQINSTTVVKELALPVFNHWLPAPQNLPQLWKDPWCEAISEEVPPKIEFGITAETLSDLVLDLQPYATKSKDISLNLKDLETAKWTSSSKKPKENV